MYTPHLLVSQVSQQQEIFTRLSAKYGLSVGTIARHIFMVSRSCLTHRKYGIIQDGTHWFHDKLTSIARKCGVSISTVKRALSVLLKEGYIRATKFYKEFQTHEKFYSWNWEKLKGWLNPPKIEEGRPRPSIEVSVSITELPEAETQDTPRVSSAAPSETRIVADKLKLSLSYIQHNLLLLSSRPRKVFGDPAKHQTIQIKVKNTVSALKDIFKRGNFRNSLEEIAHHEHKKQLQHISTHRQRDSLIGAALPIYDEDKEEERLCKIMDNFKQNVPYNELLDIWNHHLGEKTGIYAANRTTIPLLDRTFFTHFDGQKEAFQRFCEKIASTPYLMGKTFSLTLYSALSPSFIGKVMADKFAPKEFGYQVRDKNTHQGGSILDESYRNFAAAKFADKSADTCADTCIPPQSREPTRTATYSCYATEPATKPDEAALRTKVRTLVGELHYVSWFQDARAEFREGTLKLIPQSEFRRYKWDTDPEFSKVRESGLLAI